MIGQLFNNVSGNTVNIGGCEVEWPGGRGWVIIEAGAVFSGAANLNLVLSVINSTIGGLIPGASSLNIPGVYEFFAPRGRLGGAIDVSAGTVANATVWVVSGSGSEL